jgi:hypothetical protein
MSLNVHQGQNCCRNTLSESNTSLRQNSKSIRSSFLQRRSAVEWHPAEGLSTPWSLDIMRTMGRAGGSDPITASISHPFTSPREPQAEQEIRVDGILRHVAADVVPEADRRH